MIATAFAPGFLLWGRHRLGLTIAAVVWLIAAALSLALPAETCGPVVLLMGQLALPVSLVYLVTAFAFGFDGIPLEGRDSCFPTRHFTLPLRTRALVAWPMISGTFAVALAWWAWVGVVLKPHGLEDLPVAWPGFLLAAALAWLQALLWTPFGWPYVRIGLAMVAAGAFIAIMAIGLILQVPEPHLCGLYAALLIPAYGLAFRGVSRGRHGDTPDWGWPTLAAPRPPSRLVVRPFGSPAAAQWWLEARNTGVLYLLMLACVLAAMTLNNWLMFVSAEGGFPAGDRLAVLFPFTRETTLTLMIFSPLAAIPIFMGSTISIDLGKIGTAGQPSAFLLTRPVVTSDLIRAKWKWAALNTLAGGVALAVVGGLWLLIPGVAAVVSEWWRQVVAMMGPARAWAMVPPAAAAVLGMTWLQMCQGIVFGVIGRLWARVLPLILVCVFVVGAAVASWVWTSWGEVSWLQSLMPALLVVAVAAKGAALAWALRRVIAKRLWPRRTLLLVAGTWALTAGSLFVLARVVIPTESVPAYQLALGVVALTPLVRILAAPVVLDRVRHA